MDEISILRSDLADAGYTTEPLGAADEFMVVGSDLYQPATLVASPAGLEAYLTSTEESAVEALGHPDEPRKMARGLLELNLIEMFESKIVYRIGVDRFGDWVAESSPRPFGPIWIQMDPMSGEID
ncbi:hypothetical protein FOE78_14355 [Microlunatus elymi]|uniref:Uncharacterized protein n=1 Tax=Microlunatus elymi TaxID=2596828 RepID=A0A516Q0J6_9ACTN|nr:hypothetical protein [Microlunatus elymi]QDP96940.1 hypothetical protein FOE78_14355 [Microlunatus elymi]